MTKPNLSLLAIDAAKNPDYFELFQILLGPKPRAFAATRSLYARLNHLTFYEKIKTVYYDQIVLPLLAKARAEATGKGAVGDQDAFQCVLNFYKDKFNTVYKRGILIDDFQATDKNSNQILSNLVKSNGKTAAVGLDRLLSISEVTLKKYQEDHMANLMAAKFDTPITYLIENSKTLVELADFLELYREGMEEHINSERKEMLRITQLVREATENTRKTFIDEKTQWWNSLTEEERIEAGIPSQKSWSNFFTDVDKPSASLMSDNEIFECLLAANIAFATEDWVGDESRPLLFIALYAKNVKATNYLLEGGAGIGDTNSRGVPAFCFYKQYLEPDPAKDEIMITLCRHQTKEVESPLDPLAAIILEKHGLAKKLELGTKIGKHLESYEKRISDTSLVASLWNCFRNKSILETRKTDVQELKKERILAIQNRRDEDLIMSIDKHQENANYGLLGKWGSRLYGPLSRIVDSCDANKELSLRKDQYDTIGCPPAASTALTKLTN